MNIKTWILAGCTVALAVMVMAYGYMRFFTTSQQTAMLDDDIVVVATFYPLAQFAQWVGGENVSVIVITPAGVEPHDYEPTPRDIAQATGADLLLVNGYGIDHWAEEVEMRDPGSRKLVMSASLAVTQVREQDPHFWLSPLLAMQEVDLIRDALIAHDPKNEQAYIENARAARAKLLALENDFRQGLAVCAQRSVVISHDAAGYLADTYNFSTISIAGISPEEEPSAGKMQDIARLMKEQHKQFIFFETLVNPELAQTLAAETGAQTLVFNPLEGLTTEEVSDGEDYISIMRQNLANLQLAMKCSATTQ